MAKTFLSILIILLCQQSCVSQSFEDALIIKHPSIEQEATSIWRTINDINFLESQGYQIKLPKNEAIDNLIEKSKGGEFGNEDYATIYNLLEGGIYQRENYDKALAKILSQKALIVSAMEKLEEKRAEWTWDFKQYESYEIILTLYGTGGSYEPETGNITLLTNAEGAFMKYDKPANTIIHEMVHLGIENSLIQTYKVNHVLKEKIVDTIVYLLFQESLPDYQIQNMGPTAIDGQFNEAADLAGLQATIAKLAEDN
ncbi:MAG: hypothetical protein AAF927_06825 [Bacteroidota bacterium]